MMDFVKVLMLLLFSNTVSSQTIYYVSEKGNDNNKGSLSRPLKSLNAAVAKALALKDQDINIQIRGGVYYPDTTIVINADDYKLRSLTISAYKNEKVTVSGALPLRPEWTPYKKGIIQATINLKNPDRLFMGETSLPMARYPNFDSSARVFNGSAADAISKDRVRKWKQPAGGYLHGLHKGEWGGFHYLITGKKGEDELALEGGWQNNRPAPLHDQYRFVENIFEELDMAGEWFYNRQSKVLYLFPPDGADVNTSLFFSSNLNELIVIKGSVHRPVKNITISHIRFTGTNRTFMLTREPLLRSDWTIYRGGAILLDGTENIKISNCTFDNLGGNAVFVSNYNRHGLIRDNLIHNIGASALAFVGSADAVRSPSFQYDEFVPWAQMDLSPGPKSDNYPKDFKASGNLIFNIGFIEKQVAGVEIAMSSFIHITHNTIYEVPRSGINIGDGCWGGHVIEHNDVFNTVLETGDHGAFNSWGRDRFWRPEREITDSIVKITKGIELLDAMDSVIIRNNRFHCEHGWDIDLDDGSTNYQIYNNVCLNGGLKLREGYNRTVQNNIILNNTFHPHVWYENSGDIFTRNIVSLSYAPIQIQNWGRLVDYNFFLSEKALEAAKANGTDSHSIYGAPEFTDPSNNDFTLRPGSAVFKSGYVNFPMEFGVTDPELRQRASKAPVRKLINVNMSSAGVITEWLGSKLKNIETLGERSAAGLTETSGVLVVNVNPGSPAARSNLYSGDVIISIGDEPVKTVDDLMGMVQKQKWRGHLQTKVIRNQQELEINLELKE